MSSESGRVEVIMLDRETIFFATENAPDVSLQDGIMSFTDSQEVEHYFVLKNIIGWREVLIP